GKRQRIWRSDAPGHAPAGPRAGEAFGHQDAAEGISVASDVTELAVVTVFIGSRRHKDKGPGIQKFLEAPRSSRTQFGLLTALGFVGFRRVDAGKPDLLALV